MPGYSLDAKFGSVSPEFDYTLQRLENLVSAGNGTPLQPVVKSAYSVNPVYGLKAVAVAALGAESTKIILRFMEPERMKRNIGCFNIYVKGLNTVQEWQLIHTTKHSPAVFPLLPSTASQTVTFAVQTELRNGNRLDVSRCPTTAVTLV